jgi:hypothetical protein
MADMAHGNEKTSNNTQILGGCRGGTGALLKKVRPIMYNVSIEGLMLRSGSAEA